MSQPTLIGMRLRSYPGEPHIVQQCQGCRNPYAGARKSYPVCRICLVVEAQHGKDNAAKRASKRLRRHILNVRSAQRNQAWHPAELVVARFTPYSQDTAREVLGLIEGGVNKVIRFLNACASLNLNPLQVISNATLINDRSSNQGSH